MTAGRTGAITPLQQGLYAHLQLLAPEATATFNVPAAVDVEVSAGIDATRWVQSFARLCSLTGLDAASLQVVDGTLTRVPSRGPATCRAERVAEGAVADEIARETSEAFHLDGEPLVRAVLFVTGAERATALVVAHHLVADGASIAMLLRSWVDLATGTASVDDPTSLAAVEARTAGESHDDWYGGEAARRHSLAAWSRRAERIADRHAPAVAWDPRRDTGPAQSAEIELDAATLRTTAVRLGVSANVLLLSAMAVAHCRIGARSAAVLGVVMSVRTPSEQHLLGHFVNVVPVPVDLAAQTSLLDVVWCVQEQLFECHADRRVPLHEIQDEAARSAGYAALQPDVFFVDEQVEVPTQAPAVASTWRPLRGGAAKYPLLVSAATTADGSTITVNAAPGARPETAARAFHEELEATLRTYADGAEAKPWRLDRPATVDQSPAPPVVEPVEAIFAVVAEQFASHVAVQGSRDALTYRELAEGVAEHAEALDAAGVGEGAGVALLVDESSPELVAAMLACRTRGAYFVVLDPEMSATVRADVLANTRCSLLLTDRRVEVPGRAEPWRRGIDAYRLAPTGASLPQGTACVIQTSGSTGRPKSVVYGAPALSLALGNARRDFDVRPESVVPCLLPATFDMGLMQLLVAVTSGATALLLDRHLRRRPEAIAGLLGPHHRLLLVATPSQFELLAPALTRAGVGPAVHRLVLGGESVTPLTRARWDEVAPGREHDLVVIYGPTEVTIYCTVGAAQAGTRHSVHPLGRATSGYTITTRDQHDRVVPDGELGEVHVSSDFLALGYVDAGRLVQDRFYEDPRSGQRTFRTRDLARRDQSGDLLFEGRMDDQVKLFGHRLQLSHVSAIAALHPDVVSAHAAALTSDTTGRVEQIGCLVVAPPGSEAGIREHLRENLPPWAVPTALVVRDALPRNDRDKVDRAEVERILRSAVAAPRLTPALVGAPAIAAAASSDPIGSQVRALWQTALGEPGSAHTDRNFFDCGGTSMSAAFLQRAIVDQLGVRLALLDLFDNPTLDQLVETVRDRLREEGR